LYARGGSKNTGLGFYVKYDYNFHMQTVVIIDDHEITRAGLAARLTGFYQITGEAGSMDKAKALFKNLSKWPDLIILDIELGNDWGLDLIGELKKIKTAKQKIPPVLVYSVYDDYAHINAALRAGVKSYVCKSQSVQELLYAMDGAITGKGSFNSELVHRLASVSDLMLGLTKREREIFNMVQREFDNQKIANVLNVSVRTIENNLGIIYDKTGVKNREELEKL